MSSFHINVSRIYDNSSFKIRFYFILTQTISCEKSNVYLQILPNICYTLPTLKGVKLESEPSDTILLTKTHIRLMIFTIYTFKMLCDGQTAAMYRKSNQNGTNTSKDI